MDYERILIPGGGGRESALARALVRGRRQVWMTPGNAGTEEICDVAIGRNGQPIAATDIAELIWFARQNNAFTVVGLDRLLAMGIVDEFKAEGLAIFGPTQKQARIESNREFARRFADQNNIPRGNHRSFSDKDEAIEHAMHSSQESWPLFLKANGLADGKGAVRCENLEELVAAISDLEKKRLFSKDQPLLIEDYVGGPELSHHAFCDGNTQLSIPIVVRDHKERYEDGEGSMTGGMGTIGPLNIYTPEDVRKLGETFVEPVVRNLGFRGLLFSGLKGEKGREGSLEWNARFGDPETQVFLSLMKSDLLPVLVGCAEGNLAEVPEPVWHIGRTAICLVMAAPGYPENVQTGGVIEGLEEAARVQGVQVLHAGTKRIGEDAVVSSGRAINVIATGDSAEEAIDRAYLAASRIGPDLQVRSDIGKTLLAAG